MLSNPLMSVIATAYNVQSYLNRCIKFITSQTCSNLEIILADDESRETTLMIMKQWKAVLRIYDR